MWGVCHPTKWKAEQTEKSTTVLCSIRRSMVIGQTTASKIGDKQADSENCKLVGAEICE